MPLFAKDFDDNKLFFPDPPKGQPTPSADGPSPFEGFDPSTLPDQPKIPALGEAPAPEESPNLVVEGLDPSTLPDQPSRLKELADAHRDINPDLLGRALTEGERTGIDPMDLARVPEAMNQNTTDWIALERDYPATALYLGLPYKMGISQDDLPALQALEDAVGKSLPNKILSRSLNSFMLGLTETRMMTEKSRMESPYDLPTFEDATSRIMGLPTGQALVDALAKEAEGYRKGVVPQGDRNIVEKFLYNGLEQLGQLANWAYYGADAGAKIAVVGHVLGLVTGVGVAGGAMLGAGATAGTVGSLFAPQAGTGMAQLGWTLGKTLGNFATMATTEYGSALEEYRAFRDREGNPLPEYVIQASALVAGTINGILEFWQTEMIKGMFPKMNLLPKKAGTELVKDLLRNPKWWDALVIAGKRLTEVGWETLEEGTQGLTTDVMGNVAKALTQFGYGSKQEYQPFGEQLADAWDQASQAFWGLAGLGMVGFGSTMVNERMRYQEAKDNRELFESIAEGARNSKTLQRHPESFRQAVENLTKNGPVSKIFVPMERWNAYWTSVGADPRTVANEMGIGPLYQEAEDTGGELEIPTPVYAEKLSATDHHQGLADDLRLGAQAMTMRETAEAEEKAQNEREERIYQFEQRLKQDEDLRADVEKIKTFYAGQLNALTTDTTDKKGKKKRNQRKFTPEEVDQVTSLIAQTYVQMAEANNANPWEWAQMHPVRFQMGAGGLMGTADRSGTDEDGIIYDQGGQIVLNEAFHNWFGGSKVVDESGAPLVLYRGESGYDREYSEFDRNKTNENAFFFTPNRAVAEIYAKKGSDPRAFFVRAGNLLDLTRLDQDSERFIREWAKRWGDWVDRETGEEVDPVEVVESGRLFDWEGDWSGKRWKDLQATIENAGYDGAILPDYDSQNGVFPAYIVFSPNQIKSVENQGTWSREDANIFRQSAFHGSPYIFDKFTLERIGSGEGAQAYGWGLYFAGNRAVAEFYRQKLSRSSLSPTQRELKTAMVAIRVIPKVVKTLEEKGLTIEDLEDHLDQMFKSSALLGWTLTQTRANQEEVISRQKERNRPDERVIANAETWIKIIDNLGEEGEQAYQEVLKKANEGMGQLYKVNIPDDDVLLDWDKPLGEQPQHIQDAVRSATEELVAHYNKINPPETSAPGFRLKPEKDLPTGTDTGKAVYFKLCALTPSSYDGAKREIASKTLNKFGVKGNRYLDAGSRSKGEGDHNYVIFDDQAIEILETYYQAEVPLFQEMPYTPQKTIKGYKLFDLIDGELYPVKAEGINKAGHKPTPMGVWLEAEDHPTKGLSHRPGWHAGVLPLAPQLRNKQGTIQPFRVWAECEFPDDVDWQGELESWDLKEMKHDIPKGGSYIFHQNEKDIKSGNSKGWIISGGVKVNKILTDAEVADVLREAGLPPEKIMPELHDPTAIFGSNQEGKDFADNLVRVMTNGPMEGDGVALPPTVDALFQVQDLPEWEENIRKWMKDQKSLDSRTGKIVPSYTPQEIEAQVEAIRGQMAIFSALGPAVLEMLPRGAGLNKGKGKGPIRTNSDPIYKISFDASAMCPKRLEASATLQYIESKLRVLRPNRPTLDAGERLALHSLFRLAGKTAPCLYCYVEAPRAKMGEFVNNALEVVMGRSEGGLVKKTKAQRDAELKAKKEAWRQALIKEGENPDEYDFTEESEKAWSEATKAQALKAREEWKRLGLKPEDINVGYFLDAGFQKTPEGIAMAKRAPATYKFISTLASGAKANLPKLYEQYSGQILTIPDTKIAELNGYAGFRFFSSSDFQAEHVVDLIQAITDLSLKGGKAHAYTKIEDFVRCFGRTGMKIQCSIFAKQDPKTKEILMDTWQGMDWDVAKKYRYDPSYPNVGTVLVGTNDDIIRWGLEQDWIDYIIPYHASGMAKTHFSAMRWLNYQSKQNEKWDDPVKAEILKNAPEKEKDKYRAKVRMWQLQPFEGISDAELKKRYLDICTREKIIPVFDKFKDHPNYAKLKKDYSRTDTPFEIVDHTKIDMVAVQEIFDRLVDNNEFSSQIKADEAIGDQLLDLIATAEPDEDIGVKTMRRADEMTRSKPDIAPLAQDELGFYSAVEMAVQRIETKAMPGKDWANRIRALQGLRQEELEWSGILDYLDAVPGKVTKDEILELLQEHGIRLEEKTQYSDKESAPTWEEVDPEDGDHDREWVLTNPHSERAFSICRYESDGGYQVFGPDGEIPLEDPYIGLEEAKAFVQELWDQDSEEEGVSYRPYTVPGVTNYREVLLTLGGVEEMGGRHYTSPHWKTKNVLVHYRLDDRQSPTGGKMLFVEEIQSDWHQAGRRHGYADKWTDENDLQKQIRDQRHKLDSITERLDAEAEARYAGLEGKFAELLRGRVQLEWREPRSGWEREEGDILVSPLDRDDLFHLKPDKRKGNEGRFLVSNWGRTNPLMIGTEGVEEVFVGTEEGARKQLEDNVLGNYLTTIAIEFSEIENRLKGATRAENRGRDILKRMIETEQGRWLVRDGGFVTMEEVAPFLKGRESITQWRSRLGSGEAPQTDLEREYLATAGTLEELRHRKEAVPNAPFKETNAWSMLAFKRILRMAVEQGYDSIGWTTGETQSERYNLSAQVREIQYSRAKSGPSGIPVYEIHVVDHSGEDIAIGGTIKTAEEIEDLVGKELADQISGTATGEIQRIEGEGLKVGTKGMKGFYDQILPKSVEKYLRKLDKMVGVRKGSLDISTPEIEAIDLDVEGEPRVTVGGDRSVDIWEVPISENIRLSVSEGQPLFQSFDNKRGVFFRKNGESVIGLFEKADVSTLIHEFVGHFAIETYLDMERSGIAPDRVKRDLDTLRSWVGWKPGQITFSREQKEQIARGVEAYFREGKAPSVRLTGVFGRIKKWLLGIYKEASKLNVTLNDDVRAVFDRLVASQDEIDASRQLAELRAEVSEGTVASVSPAELKAIDDLLQQANGDTDETLTKKVLRGIWAPGQKKLAKKLGEIRKRVTEEEREKLKAEPVYALLREIRKPGGAKINRQEIIDRWGEEDLKNWRNMYSNAGELPLEDLASSYGFGDAEGMREALANATPFEDELAGRAQRRMNQELSEGDWTELRESALEALHNETRLEALALEQAIISGANETLDQAKKAGALRAKILRQSAEKAILGKRQDQVNPSVYVTAEARYAKLYEQALANKDLESASRYLDLRAINHAMAMVAFRKKDGIKKAVADLMKWAKRGTKTYKMPVPILDQIDSLLAMVDFTKRTKSELDVRNEIRAWVLEQQNAGEVVDLPDDLLASIAKKPWQEMTVDELTTLHDAVKSLTHLGGLQRLFTSADYQQDFEEAVEAITATIAEHTESKLQNLNPGQTLKEKVMETLKSAHYAHMKVDFLIRMLDGNRDFGVCRDLLYNPLEKAWQTEADLRAESAEELQRVMTKHHSRAEILKWKTIKINATELGIKMTRENLIALALNWGNSTSRQRVTASYGVSEQQVEALFDRTMEERDWLLVQEVWRYLETFWPAIRKLEVDMTGVDPQKVESIPVVTRYGTYDGGYYPIVYDPKKSDQAWFFGSKETATGLSNNYYRMHTKHGHTIQRLAEVNGRPLKLELGSVLTQHLSQVIHDLAFRRPLRDVNKLLINPDVARSIRDVLGNEGYRQFRPWLEEMAGISKPPVKLMEKMLARARAGVTTVTLGLKMSPVLAQIFGYFASVPKMGATHVAKSIWDFYSDPSSWKEKWEFVAEKSAFMKYRAGNWDRDIRQTMEVLVGEGKMTKVKESYFFLISLMDYSVCVPLWIEAYHMELKRSGSESQATEWADTVIRQTQSGGRAIDMADVQRGGTAQKLFTMFYSFFSTQYNMMAEQLHTTHGIKDMPRVMAFFFWAIFMPAILQELVTRGGPDDDDIEEEGWKAWLKWGAGTTSAYALSAIVGVRDLSSAILQGYRYQLTPTESAFTGLARAGFQVTKAISKGFDPDEEVDWRKLIDTTLATAEIWGQIPSKQIRTSAWYLYDWMNEDVEEFKLRELIYGKKR